MNEYQFSRDGTKFGSYTEVIARQYFSEGKIIGTDLAWCELCH